MRNFLQTDHKIISLEQVVYRKISVADAVIVRDLLENDYSPAARLSEHCKRKDLEPHIKRIRNSLKPGYAIIPHDDGYKLVMLRSDPPKFRGYSRETVGKTHTEKLCS